MKNKNKKLIIIVASLLVVIGVTFAYFSSTILSSGSGSKTEFTTAKIQSSELKVEGTLTFNDLNIYPGHQNVSSVKVTATGDNELIPYDLIYDGINTLNTPLNYTIYKTSNEVSVTVSCDKTKGVVDGALMYYEECSISNIDSLGTPIATGTINSGENKTVLASDEFITSSLTGDIKYYYIILEYPNLDENQNSDIGGSFSGKVTVGESDAIPDINIVAAYIKQEDGTYEEVADIPQDGYVLNAEKSVCSNGATPILNDDGLLVSNLTKSGTECYLYFDELLSAKDVILAGKTISSSRSSNITGILTGDEDVDSSTIYTTEDDWGTSYFFAGLPNNNWVSFAGHYWRIIRINGDGSIRLIYSGTGSAQTSGTGTQIQTSAYNSSFNDNAYVGYMYGTTGASSYSAAHANTNSSTIKGILDTWYQSNLVSKGYADSVSYADKISTEAGFCNDRKIVSGYSGYGTLGYGINATVYAPTSRFLNTSWSWLSTQNPTLKCSQSNDLFTASSSSKGNKKLTNPIGLITADEVVFAGGFGGTNNSNYYLNTGQYYWTMSPYSFGSSGDARVFVVALASLTDYRVNAATGVRPVINLKADVRLTGDGTSSSPYVVSS